MSRGFFGSGGLGKGRNPFAPKGKDMSAQFSRKRKRSLQEMVESKNTHAVRSHKEMLSDLLDARMMNPGKSGMSFKLPGTGDGDDSGGRSKGYLAAMKVAQEKRMKAKAKRNDNKVKVVPKAFGGEFGGKIDANGKITNGKGQVVATVNLETGIIKDNMGMKVGKYKPFAFGMDNKIEKIISKVSSKPGYGSGKSGNPFSG